MAMMANPIQGIDNVLTWLGKIVNAISALNETISRVFPAQAGGTSTSATGGSASALPAQPVGYLTVTINGEPKKIAFYE